jgi:hypothetical protein
MIAVKGTSVLSLSHYLLPQSLNMKKAFSLTEDPKEGKSCFSAFPLERRLFIIALY